VVSFGAFGFGGAFGGGGNAFGFTGGLGFGGATGFTLSFGVLTLRASGSVFAAGQYQPTTYGSLIPKPTFVVSLLMTLMNSKASFSFPGTGFPVS